MFDCNFIHPFQNDPGSSQSQRVMDSLLASSSKIDGRTFANLLNYFVQLSSHIKYTAVSSDFKAIENDWQPFFKNSIPFTLAGVAGYNTWEVTKKFNFYCELFERRPSPEGLQLIIYYFYYSTIFRIDQLYGALENDDLPITATLEELIKNKLQSSVASFVKLSYAAYRLFCIKRIDFSKIYKHIVWNIEPEIVYGTDQKFDELGSKHKQLTAIYSEVKVLFPPMIEALKYVSEASESNIEMSLNPLKEELKKKHAPHLALIFAFLNIFKKLQDDINGYSKKHLDFFYKDVLRFKANEAVPDQIHLVFELQKQLKQYVLNKGLLLKGDKDNNSTEIDFALDSEIVINKVQITDLRTLFLNYERVKEKTYIEGAYMAVKANTLDGIDKDLTKDIKTFSTLGNKFSKYINPAKSNPEPYSRARFGFILSSPVMFLSEGTRTVDIKVKLKSQNNCTKRAVHEQVPADPCCSGSDSSTSVEGKELPDFLYAELLFEIIQSKVQAFYIIVTTSLINQAIKLGLSKDGASQLKHNFLRDEYRFSVCCSECIYYKDESVVELREWETYLKGNTAFSFQEHELLKNLFKPSSVFTVKFSGEKHWIEPMPVRLNITGTANDFELSISTTLPPELPAVVSYNKDNLNEDFNTTQPLVKIELNDALKVLLDDLSKVNLPDNECCLNRVSNLKGKEISLYHFFRDLILTDARIDVNVCGLKTIIVQNDESLQDVNSPIYPFGVRPKKESNFYIGNEEIFSKKWNNIVVNVNWKDIPPISELDPPLKDTRFRAYYNGYQEFFVSTGQELSFVEDDKFRVKIAVLQDGNWNAWKYDESCKTASDPKTKLFQLRLSESCDGDYNYDYQFQINRQADFSPALPYPKEKTEPKKIKRYEGLSRQNFIRVTLKCQDFLHDKYPFILARQMAALGKLPELVSGAVYFNIPPGGSYRVLDLNEVFKNALNSYTLSNATLQEIQSIQDKILGVDPDSTKVADISAIVDDDISVTFLNPPTPNPQVFDTLSEAENKLNNLLKVNNDIVSNFGDKGVIIPNEPWTPIISNLALNYTATATIIDIELIHLYPFSGTYKNEAISMEPSLFPVVCDEGTLFMGLNDLIPNSNVDILFQFAEATTDSESHPEAIRWQYLDNNQWKDLREGFEIIEDATNDLTTSGIIKFALPENITNENTVMPKGLHWIKASAAKNSKSTSETLGIFTQAVKATFTNGESNDKDRLSAPLKQESITKLQVADANVKQISQPYPSFSGEVPEDQGQFYVRISEVLRHKGRAIQKFDYERLVLNAFPQIYKAKCINHSFSLDANLYLNDFPFAPGYVMLAVIPDLNKLLPGQSFEPKVPAGMIEKIRVYLSQRVSSFVRLSVMNPRYEKINFCLSVKLILGKDEKYYQEKIGQDLSEFLAPWAVGQFDKLTFGQCVNKSDIIGFLETRSYIDYISKLQMFHEDDSLILDGDKEICPKTPRSILIAGAVEVCIESGNNYNWQVPTPCDDVKLLTNYCE